MLVMYTKLDIYVLIIVFYYNVMIFETWLKECTQPPLNLQHTHTYHCNYGECCFHYYDTKSGFPDKWPLLLRNPMQWSV